MTTFYLAFEKILNVTELHLETIASYRCYGQQRYDGRDFWFVIETGNKNYILRPQIYDHVIGREQALSQLQRSSKAKLWLWDKESKDIVGIETDYFQVSPEKGIEWAKKNNRWGWAVAAMFLLCGGGLHFSSLGKEARDILKFYFAALVKK